MTQTKHQVMSLFEENREGLLVWARNVARQLARQQGTVTIDDVRRRIEVGQEVDKRVFGAVFMGKKWECVGYKKSTVPTSHSRPVGIWRYKETY